MRFLNILRNFILLAAFLLPSLLVQAQNWERRVELYDLRGVKGEEKVKVGSFKVEARYQTIPKGNGDPVTANGTVSFKEVKQGYVRLLISDLQWTDPEFKPGADWKVVFNPSWVETTPKLYKKRKEKNRYILAFYTEYKKEGSTPPAIIFTIEKSGRYVFRMGYKVLTPLTKKEKPIYTEFGFHLKDIGRKDPVVREVPKEQPKKEEEDGSGLSDADLEIAINTAVEKGDLKGLKGIIAKFPNRRPVINAQAFFEIRMTQNLMATDSTEITMGYKYFPNEVASEQEVKLLAKVGTVPLPPDSVGKWYKGKFIANRNRKYVLEVSHAMAPNIKSRVTIDPSIGKLMAFSYRDTLRDSSAVHFQLKGGGPPYFLYFYKREKRRIEPVIWPYIIYSRDTMVDKFAIARKLKMDEEGFFSITVIDAIGQKIERNDLIFIAPPPLIPLWLRIVIGVGIFVSIIAAIIIQRQKRKRDEEMDKSLAAQKKQPKLKQKSELNLANLFKESAISMVSMNDEFIQDVDAYLREKPLSKDDLKKVEGVILGRIMKFDHNSEQFHVQLERFERIKTPKTADHYQDKQDDDAWPELMEIEERNPGLKRLGWLQTGNGGAMSFPPEEQNFQEEQFNELFQIVMKMETTTENRTTVFLSRTLSGKMNNARTLRVDASWPTWDELKGD